MKKLRSLRKRLGISQSELARLAGIPRWKIGHAEVNLIKLSSSDLAQIREALVAVCRKREKNFANLIGNPSKQQSAAEVRI